MKKIPTMFVRDETKPGHPVTDECKPECLWAFQGEGIATAKIDGANCKIEGGRLFKRQKPKSGDYDEASYVECVRGEPSEQWFWEAFDRPHEGHEEGGIYECIGPKVQGNPHGAPYHALIRVAPPSRVLAMDEPNRTFAGLKAACDGTSLRVSDGSLHLIEGIVFHHPDGRMCKIKRRDFGLPWPPR